MSDLVGNPEDQFSHNKAQQMDISHTVRTKNRANSYFPEGGHSASLTVHCKKNRYHKKKRIDTKKRLGRQEHSAPVLWIGALTCDRRPCAGTFVPEHVKIMSTCNIKCLFVNLVISRFGFEGRIWVLISPVPGHCLLVAFKSKTYIG